jgi:hypothetical protein
VSEACTRRFPIAKLERASQSSLFKPIECIDETPSHPFRFDFLPCAGAAVGLCAILDLRGSGRFNCFSFLRGRQHLSPEEQATGWKLLLMA